jgi:hypothetical protein
MKGIVKGIVGAVVVAVCAAAPVYAADAPAAPAAATPAVNSQQQKMKDCNAQAKTKALTGADRKTFMKTCLSGSSAAAAAAAPAADAGAAVSSAKATQQQKMKDCNAQATAKTLKGADRKTFMSTCLKG